MQVTNVRRSIRGFPGPDVSMRLCGSSMILSAELPGFPRENLTLEVEGRTLVLRGRGPDPDPAVPVHLERRTGDFHLGILLPEGLDPSRMTASLRNGILEVSCPLGTAAKKITVTPGDGGRCASDPGSPVYKEREERQ